MFFIFDFLSQVIIVAKQGNGSLIPESALVKPNFGGETAARAEVRNRRETTPREAPEEVPMPKTVPAPSPAPAPAPQPKPSPQPVPAEPVPAGSARAEVRAGLRRAAVETVEILGGNVIPDELTRTRIAGIVVETRLEVFARALREAAQERLSAYSAYVDPEVVQESIDALLRSLTAEPSNQTHTVGFVFPEDEEPNSSWVQMAIKAIARDSSLRTIALEGRAPTSFVESLKEYGKTPRPVDLDRPIKDLIIPTAILDSQFHSRIADTFLPFWIEGDLSDPLARDYAEMLQIIAPILAAKILDERPELLKNRLELRAELLKRIQLEGFDNIITTGKRGGQDGFIVSAVLAKAYLESRAELRVKQSA
jgi:hypothetical protein